MKARRIILIFIAFVIGFNLCICNIFAASTGNGGGGGGSTHGGGNANADSTKFRFLMDNNNFLMVRITLQYYNENTKKMHIVNGTKPYYVIRHASGDMYSSDAATKFGCQAWIGQTKISYSSTCVIKENWFWHNSNGFGYDADQMFKDLMGAKPGSRTVSDDVATKHLSPWLKKLNKDPNHPTVTLESIKENIRTGKTPSCEVKGHGSTNCFKKSGYRFIVEPIIRLVPPKNYTEQQKQVIKKNNIPVDTNGKNHGYALYPTIKQAGKIDGKGGFEVKNYSNNNLWDVYGDVLYTEFNDIGIKALAPGKDAVKSENCVKNKTYNNYECGYGYNIVDISAALEQTYCELDDEHDNKCNIVHTGPNAWIEKNKNCLDSAGNALTSYTRGGKSYSLDKPCPAPEKTYCTASKTNPEKCNIIHNGKNGWKALNIDCSDSSGNALTSYKHGGQTYSFEQPCPVTTYSCEINKDEYGRCKIIMNNTEIVENNIDCNDGKEGRKNYKGHKLTLACPYSPKYNYDIDAACEKCENGNTKGSYQIQDVADWKAIYHTLQRNDAPELKEYFTVQDNYLCREEYNIVLPNKNNVDKIYAKSGKFITVNEDGTSVNNGVYNFETIKVKKTRQCINKNGTNDFNSLIKFTVDKTSSAAKLDMGQVNLNYIEPVYGHTFALEPDLSRIYVDKTDGNVTIDNNIYPVQIETKTAYFKLSKDVYKYASIGDGKSSLEKPNTADLKKYRDMGVANLPISFTNKEGVKIKLSYKFPKNSKFWTTFFSKNNPVNYLSSKSNSSEDNIYKRDENDKTIAKGACYNLWQGTNDKWYNECVNNRKADGTYIANRCINNFIVLNPDNNIFNITDSEKLPFVYTCKIKSGDSNDPNPGDPNPGDPNPGDPNPGDPNPGDPNPGGKKCVFYKSKYYGKNGNVVSKIQFAKECSCHKEGNNCYNDVGNLISCNSEEWKKSCTCKVITSGNNAGLYLGKEGDLIDNYKQYDNQCCDINESSNINNFNPKSAEVECPNNEAMGLSACYRCPVTGLCPMPGNICPGSTDNYGDIIYRPIDLKNPFPGQSGQENGRETGSNWCTRNENNVILSCSGKSESEETVANNNALIYKEIINNRDTKDYSLYSEKPLYTVNLNSDAINFIRKEYNKKSDYDSWINIEFNENDKIYSSKFLKNLKEKGYIDSKTSICMTSKNKKTCAEG